MTRMPTNIPVKSYVAWHSPKQRTALLPFLGRVIAFNEEEVVENTFGAFATLVATMGHDLDSADIASGDHWGPGELALVATQVPGDNTQTHYTLLETKQLVLLQNPTATARLMAPSMDGCRFEVRTGENGLPELRLNGVAVQGVREMSLSWAEDSMPVLRLEAINSNLAWEQTQFQA
jgi:hypothetical protein